MCGSFMHAHQLMRGLIRNYALKGIIKYKP